MPGSNSCEKCNYIFSSLIVTPEEFYVIPNHFPDPDFNNEVSILE